MDSKSCMHPTKKTYDSSPKSTLLSDETGGAEANKLVVESSLGPITPDSTKENGDFPLDLSSPLTSVKRLPKVLSFSSKPNSNDEQLSNVDDSASPKTPKDGVFDPFAPGPDNMILAPHCKKFFDETRASVARRLNLGSPFRTKRIPSWGGEGEALTDENMFESVYENLLEAILYNQTESALAEMSNLERDSDSCRTPPSAPHLSGVAETCPGAPLKPTGKSRIIDLGLCRKLEF